MKKMRSFLLMIAVVSSLFMTGCDAGKIMEVINQVADVIEQAVPVVKEVIDTVNEAFGNANNNPAPANNNQPAETGQTADANVVVNSPGDQEDLPGTNNGGSQTPADDSAADASAAEAALANYSGGRLAPSEFARLFGPVARAASRNSGVPASIIVAQAALETGWGASAIGDAKNLFGIKGTGPAGSVRVPTREYRNGRMVTEMANFRKYNTWQESIEDYGRLLQNSRYANAMANRDDPEQFARELQRAGYATDPEYASKLISIMRSNNLYQYNN